MKHNQPLLYDINGNVISTQKETNLSLESHTFDFIDIGCSKDDADDEIEKRTMKDEETKNKDRPPRDITLVDDLVAWDLNERYSPGDTSLVSSFGGESVFFPPFTEPFPPFYPNYHNEIQLTFHVRSIKNSNWDMAHSVVSFFRKTSRDKSAIGKYRKAQLVSSIERFEKIFLQIVDAEGKEIPVEEKPLFALCTTVHGVGASYVTGPGSVGSKNIFEFYIQVDNNQHKVALQGTMFLHINVTTTATSNIIDTIPLFSGDHKYPSGAKQSLRLKTGREALVARGKETKFSALHLPDYIPILPYE